MHPLRRFPRLRRLSALVTFLTSLFAAGLLACGSPARVAWQTGIPGRAIEMRVAHAEQRADLIDVGVEAPGLALRSFTPADPTCLAILRPDTQVLWRSVGAWGRFEADGQHCIAIGIGSLAEWRDRRADPARGRGGPLPRRQAVFTRVYEDAAGFLVRGRFPLAERLGWTGSQDTVAVLPATPACARAAREGVASLEYRAAGPQPLQLLSEGQSCPLEGLVIPAQR